MPSYDPWRKSPEPVKQKYKTLKEQLTDSDKREDAESGETKQEKSVEVEEVK